MYLSRCISRLVNIGGDEGLGTSSIRKALMVISFPAFLSFQSIVSSTYSVFNANGMKTMNMSEGRTFCFSGPKQNLIVDTPHLF